MQALAGIRRFCAHANGNVAFFPHFVWMALVLRRREQDGGAVLKQPAELTEPRGEEAARFCVTRRLEASSRGCQLIPDKGRQTHTWGRCFIYTQAQNGAGSLSDQLGMEE